VASDRPPVQPQLRPEREAEAPAAARVVEAPRGTVVDVMTSPDRRRPDRARFLAERDGTVERETRSRHTGREEWASPAPRPMAGGEGRQGSAASGEEGDAEERVEGRVGDATATPTPTPAPTPTATAAPTATATANPAVEAARALLARANGDGGRREAGRWDPRLMPVGARFDGAAGGGPSASVPPDIALGDETWLNTRRFRYAEFYSRVAAAIRREWDPNRAWNARDPNDTILGRRTRQARFDLHIAPDGRLREALLVESSGLGFLDRECLRAIEAAAPFPNPPAGLVEQGGAIVLRGWVLSFDFGARGLADAFRR
jgi:TonB family protein